MKKRNGSSSRSCGDVVVAVVFMICLCSEFECVAVGRFEVAVLPNFFKFSL